MQVLVTGGTGVVGRSTVTALVQRGHVVRLFSRHARRDAREWSQGVHPIPGDVADGTTVRGAAEGCEAVLHLAGIVDESGASTFARVNVEGTRHVLREAERAGVARFIYVSSLGADRGGSPYHKSKRQGESIARTFPGDWRVVRPANVFGPGDEQISLLLRMIRTLPSVPVIGDGNQPFQPLWHEDLADALALAVERDDLAGRELDLAGGEVTTQNDLIDRLSALTGRTVVRVPVPEMLAGLGLRVASAVGLDVAFNESQLRMLLEGGVIPPGGENALITQFGITPTPLNLALRQLADAQPEQLPDHGVGPLRRKRLWADIQGSAMTPEQLLDRVAAEFAALLPPAMRVAGESGAVALEEDATLTLALPVRGHAQVRVAEREPRSVTLLTLAGHPLSGAVRLLSEARGADLRFEVQVYDRAANVMDLVLMRTLGERLQDASWRELIENVVRVSGGSAGSVHLETETLDDDQADRIEDWLRDLVVEKRREAAGI